MAVAHHDHQPSAEPGLPTQRPSSRLAVAAFVLLSGMVAVLSFADRAPGVIRRLLRANVRISTAFEDLTGVPVLDARALPQEWDTLGHFVLWFVVAVVGRWAFRRSSPVGLGLALFVASYAVEIGQSYLTTSRALDMRDLVANGLGIAAGMILAVGLQWTAQRTRRFRGS